MEIAAFPGERRFLAGVLVCAAAAAAAVALISGTLIWLAGFGAGLALVSYALALLRRCGVASNWNERRGRILSASVESVFVPDEATDTEYRPQVRYEYEGDAGARTGSLFSVSSSLFRARTSGEIESLLLSYRPATNVTVKVCPTCSDWAVLRTDMLPRRRSHVLAALVGGLLVALVSAAAAILHAL
ncbi:DUF3592 domain-containing protein [Caenimonas terrae]|uniref:DUF3592 domain-containing protein n=1 Tax=Caenimonas terrae TaxID=696074 RepID=A0ABW0NHL6_9BURK